jgi:GT2 family glycosyltransferase
VKIAIIVSPNWRDYAEKYLSGCMEGLRKQEGIGEHRIFLTDNETSEESFAYLKKEAPEAEIIRNKENAGFAKGSNDAMRVAIEQGYDYIVLLNMDAIAETNCIAELVKAAESDDSVGAVQARIMLWPDKDRINSMGNVNHFLGFGYCRGYNEQISDYRMPASREICHVSGSAALFKRSVLDRVGLFDETFWMYNEDQDLSWRIWLAGFKCILAPEAAVYHKYEFSRSTGKYYWLDRNRILSILINYHWLTLMLILPAFLVMEAGLFFFALKGGWIKEKISVYKYLLNPQKWRHIRQARRRAQTLRRVRDRDIVGMFSGNIWYEEIADYRLRLVNPLFNAYWGIAKRLIIW